MPFWDRFVLALYFGLARHLPAGRDAALRVLDLAVGRGRLALSGLSDTSLLLLLAFVPTGNAHRRAVAAEVTARGWQRTLPDSAGLLAAAAPPRLMELVEIDRRAGTDLDAGVGVGEATTLRAMARGVMHAPIMDGLSLYLGRITLVDHANPGTRQAAGRLLLRAMRGYFRIPEGTWDFLAYLYHYTRALRLPGVALPSALPVPTPAWFSALEVDEQRLIEDCLRFLPEPELDALYLHFHARLAVPQITRALFLRRRAGARGAVIRRLERAWSAVL